MQCIAVLTGDLISSTSARVEAVERAMLTLSQAARTLGEWAGHDTRFTRFRGDGWQVYLERPGLTLRAALFVTAFLRAADVGLATRMAIAIAPGYRLGEAGLSGASGLAFERSGHGLDLMKAQDLVAFDMPSPNVSAPLEPWQAAVLNLALWQASRWSREQATAMALALHPRPPTQDRIAQSLGITRQAVQIRLKGAGLHALKPSLAAFEMEPKP